MSRMVIYFLYFFLFLFSVVFSGQKEIEVSTFYAKVYVAPSTNANFIGLIQKGERYPILGVKDNWYNIRFKNVNGWIEFSQATVIDPEAVAAAETNPAAEIPAPSQSTVAQRDTTPQRTGQIADTGRSAVETVASTTLQNSEQKNVASNNNTLRTSPVLKPTPYQQQRPTYPARVPERKESRIRSWFSQPNTPELPPILNPNDDQSELVMFFQVNFPSPVRGYLDPSAPIIGMSKRGQMLQLIGEGDLWCKIAFRDTVGWIEKKYGRIVNPNAAPPLDYMKIGLIAGILLIVLVVIFILVSKFRRVSIPAASRENVAKKNVLIISYSQKMIQYTLTSGTTTLERCFAEVGFNVSFVKNGNALKSGMQQHKPDVVMIDFLFDVNIIPVVVRLCSSLGISDSVMAIVFNVPDPSEMHSDESLPNMLFLGVTFSDRDIFKLITPMLRSANGENIQKSVHGSALAGNIADGNLLEVLQFIEIGSKTGCLLIELETPFAIICFKNGRINFAATADKIVGRDAIFKVLELKKGKFRFVLDKKPKTSNINLSTLEVLMEWTKTLDEAHGH
jgi:hypothetical protein